MPVSVTLSPSLCVAVCICVLCVCVYVRERVCVVGQRRMGTWGRRGGCENRERAGGQPVSTLRRELQNQDYTDLGALGMRGWEINMSK